MDIDVSRQKSRRIMHRVAMPGGKDSEISYRVKCVVVESERVFGNVVVTRQTRNRLYRVNACHLYPDVSRRNLSNLTKRILETPDFMALNSKPIDREVNVEVTAILPISDEKSASKNRRNGTVTVDTVNGCEELENKQKLYPLPMIKGSANREVVVSTLVDQLLLDIYGYPRSERGHSESDSTASSREPRPQRHRYPRKTRLPSKRKEELHFAVETLKDRVRHAGGLLIRQLRRRDYLVAKRDKRYDVITAHLQAHSAKRSEDTRMRFSLTPQPGESGFTQWLDAMKMVARLQGGIPQEFRKTLWLTLTERHLEQRGVNWKQAEKLCFNEWSNPDDEELGIQIVKDLHRTGCSLFCGAAGRDNQAVLRRVLLGFARWNKSVGYCQGLNVLAAFVLQVTDRAESSAVKVMIYLIEGVLPEGYFADNLRGLLIDMAVFRDLLRIRLPKLSRHLEALQSDAKDKATGNSYEPPLTNVFTMQWFLTLFCHCLPEEAVLRVWDLIFLEGDEILLRTALAIWEGISDRIMTVTSADEFYSIMGVLTREMLEFTDVNNLIKTIVNMEPLYGVTDLREKHRYNITPWARRLSDDEDTDTEEDEKLAAEDRSNASLRALQTISPANDRERLALDITTLKQQYAKLRERQRQAHIILSAACARQSMMPTSTSQAMNHLLAGKSALVSAKTRQLGPPMGAIPPKPRTPVLHSSRVQVRKEKQAVTLHWKDTKKSKETSNEPAVGDESESATSAVNTQDAMSVTLTSPKRGSATDSDSDSTSTELCDEPDRLSDVDSEEPTSTSDCYVMATDDEKSPRSGSSPIAGDTSSHRSSENQGNTKRETVTRQVYRLTRDIDDKNDYYREEPLDIEETSSSIAKITDEIRKLSASDADNPSFTGLRRTAKDSKITVRSNEHEESFKVISPNDTFREGDSVSEDSLTKKGSPVGEEAEETSQTDYPLSEQSFQILDSYDFLSDRVTPGTSDKPEDGNASLKDKYREKENLVKENINVTDTAAPLQDKYREAVTNLEEIAPNNTTSSGFSISELEKVQTNANAESVRQQETFSLEANNETMSRFDSNSLRSDNCEKNGLESKDSVFLDRPVSNQLETVTNERTFYPRSYVIGHLPISPATVNEKLGKGIELSPLKGNVNILSKEKNIGSFDSDVIKNVDTTFGALTKSGLERKTMNLSSVHSIGESSNDHSESVNYDIHKKIHLNLTSTGMPMGIESRVDDTVVPSSEKQKRKDRAMDFESASKSSNINSLSSPLNGIATTPIDKVGEIDNGLTKNIDRRISVSRLSDRKLNLTDERKNVTTLNLIGINTRISSSQLSPDYGYHNSSSTKINEEKKKSPKTPGSAKSFSSGETMGPDSITSSLITSPRTPNRPDSRMFVIDNSELSLVSSDSKTLTLGSLDLDAGADGTMFDIKPDVARPSLDKSNSSTPMSSDSLKNKCETSPKFVTSTSSESCSPGKAKSSERSFSSELRSPISANSIKYRRNYAEGQDHLSESPMDVCSVTSPFYPIVNPNQNTPSPCGATEKQTKSTVGKETWQEEKSTSSREEANSVEYGTDGETVGASKLSEVAKSLKQNDDYDSTRPFEKELADTLSILPNESLKINSAKISSLCKEDPDVGSYGKNNATEEYLEKEIREGYKETDTISVLPRDNYERSAAFVDKVGSFKGIAVNGRDHAHSLGTKESLNPFQRSCSSLEKRFTDTEPSPSSEELGTNSYKKRSSDILEDLRNLEAKSSSDGTADTSILARKTGYDWEDLKNLEARRQDNFSDSADEFSRDRLNVRSINLFGATGKSCVAKPRINIEEDSDSILKSYSRKKSNGEPDNDRESKLGVWTKVKPRANRDNGRRSSDRALKIIQENSAILHKILTCQAKKRLPDLEEISKEITISPINEEISKIFSPILEKMGLNEHEINEELARINFQGFEQITATSGSEFDAKINDELCKLSLIDDNEIVDHSEVDEVIARDYLDTREALIDRQINEELSKLLANYKEPSSIGLANRDESSSLENLSELEGLELSGISNNVFSYRSSIDSIETKSELGSIQDSVIPTEKYPLYTENVTRFRENTKYGLRGLSPRSDIDIYRELEKLEKISSGEIVPSASATIPRKIVSPMRYAGERPSYAEARPCSPEYRVKPEKSFDLSPMKSPYDTYKPYDFKSRISPRKSPSNPYSARSYEKAGTDASLNFHENPTTPSRLYDLGTSRPLLSKETLEFRVRYDEGFSKEIRNGDLASLEAYQSDLADLNRGASYYSNDEPSMALQRLSTDAERTLSGPSVVSPLDYAYDQTDLYTRKYDPLSLKNYSYPKTTSDHDKPSYKLDKDDAAGSYLPLRRKNSHSLSPNYRYGDGEFATPLNPYNSELPPSLEEASKKPIPHPEFAENATVAVCTEVLSRDSINFRKASMSLGLNESASNRTVPGVDATPSPRSRFSPFPVRNASRKPKELGLKLGLYSPGSPGATSLKRS